MTAPTATVSTLTAMSQASPAPKRRAAPGAGPVPGRGVGVPTGTRPPRRDRIRHAWRRSWRYVFAVFFGLLFLLLTHTSGQGALRVDWRFWLDLTLGPIGVLLLRWRHRQPVGVMVAESAFATVSGFSAAAWVLAVGSLSTRRRWPDAVLTLVLAGMTGVVTERIYPENASTSWWVSLVFNLPLTIAIIAFGWYVGARRDLLDSFRERAETAEREQALRTSEAKAMERAAIAREMHDVLAHRISLIAMHAGALAYRTDLTPEETRTTAGLLQETAHQALGELRGVLGVLRSEPPATTDAGDGADGPDAPDPALERGLLAASVVPGGADPERPQPTLAELPDLVTELRSLGMRIELHEDLPAEVAVPTLVGRHTYRIVQEALTNARKHAPGVPVSVRVVGDLDGGVTVEVVNPVPLRRDTAIPGSGYGLIGLSERAILAGGELSYGVTPDDRFRVTARLPGVPPRGASGLTDETEGTRP